MSKRSMTRLVLKILKNDFLHLVNTIPALSLQISRRLGVRIKKLYESTSFQDDPKIISLIQMSTPERNELFAYNFSSHLYRETHSDVLLISFVNAEMVTSRDDATKSSKSRLAMSSLVDYTYAEIKSTIDVRSSSFSYIEIIYNAHEFTEKDVSKLLTDLLSQLPICYCLI